MTDDNSASKLSPNHEAESDANAAAAFLCGHTLANEVKANLGKLDPTTEETLWPRVFSLSLFAKAYKTYQAVQSLWAAGFVEDSLALSRTLFEIDLILRRIAAAPGEATTLLLEARKLEAAFGGVAFPADGDNRTAFANLLRSRDTNTIAWVKRKLGLQLVGQTEARDKVSGLNQSLDDIARGMNFYEKGPLGVSISQMAKDAGAAQTGFYRTWYRFLSCIIHSHPSTYDWYQVPGAGGCGFSSDPDPTATERVDGTTVALLASGLLLDVVEGLNDVPQLQQAATTTSIAKARNCLSGIASSLVHAG